MECQNSYRNGNQKKSGNYKIEIPDFNGNMQKMYSNETEKKD